jgi:hypothetical protein
VARPTLCTQAIARNLTVSIIPNMESLPLPQLPMAWIAGPPSATCAKIIQHPRNTFPQTFPVGRTWTKTALGVKNLNMVTSGIPTRWKSAGLPTATATGTGLALGVGLGLGMSLGASHRITMAGGSSSAAGGAGARVRYTSVRSMVPRLLVFWAGGAGASGLDSAEDSAWAGFRLAFVSLTTRVSMPAAGSSTTSIFTTRGSPISTS